MNVLKTIPGIVLTNILKWTASWEENDQKHCLFADYLLFDLLHLTCLARPIAYLAASTLETWRINLNAKTLCSYRAPSPKQLGQELFDKLPPAMEIIESFLDWFAFSRQNWKFTHPVTGTVPPCHNTFYLLLYYLSLLCLLFPPMWSKANNAGIVPAPIAPWCSDGLWLYAHVEVTFKWCLCAAQSEKHFHTDSFDLLKAGFHNTRGFFNRYK